MAVNDEYQHGVNTGLGPGGRRPRRWMRCCGCCAV